MSGLGLGLGLGLGAHRKVGAKDPGELPATFTVTAGDGTKYVRVQVSETTTVTPAGGTSIRIGSSGDFVTTPLTLAANTNQDIYFKDAGSFTIPRRKLVTYLHINYFDSSAITSDITGMRLTYLWLQQVGSSVITGDITGMKLTYLHLYTLSSSVVITGDITGMELTSLRLESMGSSVVITGDITGMELTILRISNIGSSVITGDITGMKLTHMFLTSSSSVITGYIAGMPLVYLYLSNIGSSLTYGRNSLNITSDYGIQLLGDTVFATAAEYEQLFIDAAASTWSHQTTRPLTITGSGKNFHRDYYDWGTFSATPGASSPTPSAIAIKSLVNRGTNPVVVTLEGISAYSYAGGFPENFENWWAE